MVRSRLMLAFLGAALIACSIAAPAPEPNPDPALDDRPEIIEIIAPAANAQETLDSLNLGEPGSELSERNKRTIGILRQLFPTLTQIIEQKIQMLTSQLFQTVGRAVLGGVLGGGNRAGENSGTGGGGSGSIDLSEEEEDDADSSSNSAIKISIDLPTSAPSSVEKEDVEDSDAAPASATSEIKSLESTVGKELENMKAEDSKIEDLTSTKDTNSADEVKKETGEESTKTEKIESTISDDNEEPPVAIETNQETKDKDFETITFDEIKSEDKDVETFTSADIESKDKDEETMTFSGIENKDKNIEITIASADIESKDKDIETTTSGESESKDKDTEITIASADIESEDKDIETMTSGESESKDKDIEITIASADIESKDKDIETTTTGEIESNSNEDTSDSRNLLRKKRYVGTSGLNVDENQLISGAESQQSEVRVQFADEAKDKSDDDQQTAAQTNSAQIDELTLDDTDVNDENRNKRFLNFGLGGAGGSGGSGGGSGNFLFDIIRRPAESMARAAGTAFRVLTGTDSIDLGITATSTATRDALPPLQLVAGSGATEQTDENAAAADGAGADAGVAKGDGYTEGIPGPITRLFIIANRGVANLIQDLILRLAQTSERIVNFKARLITSII